MARVLLQLLAAVGIAAAIFTPARAEKPASKTRAVTPAECKRLIEQLVNPHPPPPSKKSYVYEPPTFDPKVVAKIRKAYDTLSDNIQVSLPVLVKHANDERFSHFCESPGAFPKVSVGAACHEIVEAHVEVYLRYVERDDQDGRRIYHPSFIWKCGGVAKWWTSRKNKTFAKLQLEAINWFLRKKKPRSYKSQKAWAKALKAVRKMAQHIRRTSKPIQVRHHFPWDYPLGK
jgi:hypothetical protein